jgi:uncharacterized SAM-binding protein YcdF (DUF218 family)
LATALLIPPTNLIAAGVVGFGLHRRRAGRLLLGVALVGLSLLSLPMISGALIASLTTLPATTDPPAAIVILGAEVSGRADQPADVAPGQLTLERLRTGAALQRQTQLPVLVTGGIVRVGIAPVATVMAQSLAQDFGVPVQWVETRSDDTWENAKFSAAILKAANIHAVYLVSQDWHLRRAMIAIRHFGIDPTPAPVQRNALPTWSLDGLIPSLNALLMSYYALHEWIGCGYYSLRS